MKTKQSDLALKKQIQLAAGKKAAVTRAFNKKIASATSPRQAAAFKAHIKIAHDRINNAFGLGPITMTTKD